MQRLPLLITLALLTSACANPHGPLPRPAEVDLQRFMGDWYVIGFIPLYPERHAHNGVESYTLIEEGTIAVTYRFNHGSPNGPVKTYRPTAKPIAGTGNTQWDMQFFWPFSADYRIAYVSKDYSETIIARQARDYVWLMARSPTLPPARLQALTNKIAAMGYDLTDFTLQPQQWPER